MKNVVKKVLVALGVGLLSYAPAQAQLSVEATGGYGFPTEEGSKGIWGGGLAVKYYLSSQLAVGARVRTYAETIRQEGNGLNGRLTAASIPLMGTVEYHLVEADLHPYVGLEAGIIRTALDADLRFNGTQIYNDTFGETNLGLAPKIGLAYDLTQGISLMAEALYNVGFGKNQAGDTQFNLESSSKFLTVHAGVSLTFGNRFN